jgi:hypothetical protein
MTQARPSGGLTRGFYLWTSAFVAALAATICLQLLIALFGLGAEPEPAGMMCVFFVCSLFGHRLKNYLWANLVAISVIVACRLMASGHPAPHEFLQCGLLFAAGFVNTKAMLVLRKSIAAF